MKILAYGATGSQGNPVARKLLEAGHEVRVLTRRPDGAAALADKGAHVLQGDMSDSDSLASATEGQDGVFLHVPFFTEKPDDGVRFAHNAVEAATKAGVKLLVWNSSGEIPPERSGNPGFDLRLDVQELLEKSGIPYIILQPTAYMENFLGPWTREELVTQNIFAYPTPLEVEMQWLATEDIGTFAAYAFAHPELAPLNLKVSGPEKLNAEEVAARFSQALGREITFRAMPASEFGDKLDAVYPGMGAGAAQGYQMAYEQPDMFSSQVDLDAALAKMPVDLTSLRTWVSKHKAAFSTPANAGGDV